MANRQDKGVRVFSASATGNLEKRGFTKADLDGANAVMQDLAKDASNPMNRYQIAQIMSFVVDDIVQETDAVVRELADVKNVGVGDTAEFRVKKNEIKAYVQAKGGTPFRSKIINNSFAVNSQQIAARPYMNFYELATGRVDFSALMASAANAINLEKVRILEETLKSAIPYFPTAAVASGSTLTKETFDELFFRFKRMGQVRILGDISLINELSKFSGYDGKSAPSDIAQEEIRKTGYVGTYLGATVHELINPPTDADLNPTLSYNSLYILAGNTSPLKFSNEGGVRSMDFTSDDDESYQVTLRQDCGAALAMGDIPTLGVYTIV